MNYRDSIEETKRQLKTLRSVWQYPFLDEDTCTAEGGSWVTIRGTHICIKKGETAAAAFKRTTGKELGEMSPREQRFYGSYGQEPSGSEGSKTKSIKAGSELGSVEGEQILKPKNKEYSTKIEPAKYQKPVMLKNEETGEIAVFESVAETSHSVGYQTKRGVVWLPKSNAHPVNLIYAKQNREILKAMGFSVHGTNMFTVKNWLWKERAIGMQKWREIDPSYRKGN